MAFFIHPNQCVLFFRDAEEAFTPARLKQVLAVEGVSVEGEREPFALRWCQGPTLHASITRGETAAVLAVRLAGRASSFRAAAEECDTYIQIAFESLDEVLDEINTLIVVQSTLQQATGGLLYRSWNQSFSGPNE